jgi:hypothetical protein
MAIQFGACAVHAGYLWPHTYARYTIFIAFPLQKYFCNRPAGYITCIFPLLLLGDTLIELPCSDNLFLRILVRPHNTVPFLILPHISLHVL